MSKNIWLGFLLALNVGAIAVIASYIYFVRIAAPHIKKYKLCYIVFWNNAKKSVHLQS